MVKHTGRHISAFGLDNHGLRNASLVHWNDTSAALYGMAVERGEGLVAKDGPLVVQTGTHTGRSAQDKFTVRDSHTEKTVWWDNNKSMTLEQFDSLRQSMLGYAQGKELWVQDLYGGADPQNRINVRIVTQHAWHALFIRHLLVEPALAELPDFTPDFTILHMPDFEATPELHGSRGETVIAVNFAERMVLIGGTSYAGEIKKSVFTILNYLLPERGIMPMHCSVNVGDKGDSAIFFGLSGTGKTTLSADPDRTLIGDDEHGWADNTVFNFEGGCYAKMIRLSEEQEPDIYATTRKFGTVLENVVIDPETRELDLDDDSLAENSRGAYPISYISNASDTGVARGHPKNIIMLTADAFGVLPPIAKLSPAQAEYHFLSGYTAKVAGTEKGVTEPTATFSTCFGGPFMPRHPSEYGNLLREKIAANEVDCWLVNTGWTGGPYGIGHRMPIRETRALLTAALDGSLSKVEMRPDPNFGFLVPIAVPGVDQSILDPRTTWDDKQAYDAQARKLVTMFIENFAQFERHVCDDVRNAAPSAA
ncbi:MAG TPA: phosphoenolpyruvate carboxykinase (ATP) [Alphaproteobacteria bacterium]|nr:phosphoenolpyruvate carboxykinase (ATP) [Alphaproteobacteria bacterium]